MADQADHQMGGVEEAAADKGKGKAPQAPIEESAAEDSSDESGAEDHGGDVEADDDDGMEAIDTSNIVNGRTRGKVIDYAKANEELPPEDEEEEDDEDFEEPEDDAMEE